MRERNCTVIIVAVEQMIDTGQPEANDTLDRTKRSHQIESAFLSIY